MNRQVQLTKDDWAIRIAGATPQELVVICLELIIENLGMAEGAFKTADLKLAKRYAQKAQDFLLELMESLDLEYQIARDLMSIYLYVNSLIIRADIRQRPEPVSEALFLMTELAEAFNAAHSECRAQSSITEAPVMHNSQQVYAGLTYGRSSLNESVVQNSKRGFKV